MKKQLLSIFGLLTVGSVMAQTPSPSWPIVQNASFSITSAGHRFLDAVDPNVVWLAGYDGTAPGLNYNWFSRTINGGTSYNSGNIYSDTNTYQLANLEGIDANTAWASAFMKAAQGQGAIHRTTNGGTSWINMTAPGMFTNTAAFTDFVSFPTPNDGLTVGDPVNGEFEIWTTSNGGTSWTPVPGANIPNPLAGEFGIVDLYCKQGSTNVWFGTQKGRVYRTTDAGLTWNVSAIASAPNSTITELAFATPSIGVIYAQGSAGMEVYNTIDGGVTWNLITPSPAGNLGRNDICGIPGTSYFASVDNQNGMISYSTDNGLTWTDWGSTGIGYTCIDFANSYSGWAGSFSDNTNPSIGGIFKYNGVTFNSSFTLPQYLCKPAGDATVSPVNTSTGTSGPYTYTWTSNPATAVFSSATATNPVITFSATGIYTITLAAQGSLGTGYSSQVINVLTCAAPTASFNMQATACNSVVITLTNTSAGVPNPAISVSSNPATNVTITPGSGSLYTAKFGTAGTYTISLLATNAAGSDTYTQSILITDCTPTVGFTIENEACRTNTLLTVNNSVGAVSYTWTIAPTSGVTTFSTVGINKLIAFSGTNTTTYTLTLKGANPSGTNTEVQLIKVTPDNCVGINEITNLANNMKVYPNPAHDQINLVLPSDNESVNVRLTNILGSVIYDEKFSATAKEKISINVSNQAKGVYFLTVETKSEKATQKVVIE